MAEGLPRTCVNQHRPSRVNGARGELREVHLPDCALPCSSRKNLASVGRAQRRRERLAPGLEVHEGAVVDLRRVEHLIKDAGNPYVTRSTSPTAGASASESRGNVDLVQRSPSSAGPPDSTDARIEERVAQAPKPAEKERTPPSTSSTSVCASAPATRADPPELTRSPLAREPARSQAHEEHERGRRQRRRGRPPEGERPAPQSGSTEDATDLDWRRHLELIVPALRRRLVRAPAFEVRRVAKARALEMVVRDLGDALDPQRLP